MSKIDELIQNICPNGVEYKKLGDLCEIRTGKLNANAKVENGLYPFFTCDSLPFRINTYSFDTEAILVSGNGSQVGHINYYNGKFDAYQRTYVLSNFNYVDIKFLLHFLRAYLKEYIMLNSNKGSVPYITLPMLQDYLIPFPPVEVQQEIVRILDKFTALSEKLNKELELRKKQYEYYREKILSFEGQDMEWFKLEEVFETRNGYTPSKANKTFWEDGTIPWFVMDDIREKGRFLFDSKQHITSAAVKGEKYFPRNSIILATSATIGEHAILKTEGLANQRFTNLVIRKSFKDKLLTDFVFFYMFIIDEWCKKNVNISGFASVDMKKFQKLPIPIPPLAEQERIVSILDKFDTLINDQEKGLPAEIRKVQQQYEYYRDKLLTF